MSDSSLTALLRRPGVGNRRALDDVIPIIYDRLRRLAHRTLRREREGHTLSTTGLAHEAYLELAGMDRIEWQNRSHFFAVAATAMRRILIDHAVGRNALKRGGKIPHQAITTAVPAPDEHIEELLTLDRAMARLEQMAPRAAKVVEYRILMGMTIEETADAMSLSPATVKRHWTTARAWLIRELSSRDGNASRDANE